MAEIATKEINKIANLLSFIFLINGITSKLLIALTMQLIKT